MSFYKDWVMWAIIAVAALAFYAAAQINLFETIHEFTRRHESWELDEILSLAFILPFVLPVMMYRYSTRLRAALAAKEKAEMRARHFALHDHLTGLPNRRYFKDTIDSLRTKVSKDRIMVMMIDLDYFKQVNDLYGHAAGDLLLVEAGARLKRVVAGRGEVMRLGGDEFVAVVHGLTDEASDNQVAQELIGVISKPFEVLDCRAMISCTIGIAQMVPQITEADLLRKADIALYASKVDGRGRSSHHREATIKRNDKTA